MASSSHSWQEGDHLRVTPLAKVTAYSQVSNEKEEQDPSREFPLWPCRLQARLGSMRMQG